MGRGRCIAQGMGVIAAGPVLNQEVEVEDTLYCWELENAYDRSGSYGART